MMAQILMYLYDDGIYFLTEYKNNVLYGFYVTDKNFEKSFSKQL